ncbi:hypothetical protein V9P73_002824 [Yersinia enterocolitica]|uniref:hypothetical protein n=1 Tax=Yersinia enterocolitica TaxID=630 RepID=UPI0028B501A8|nr:hypothetical protein [Yersinia enterocolitica]HDL8228740.1 hypothetical protein [Yersinia enterocolitica]HDY4893776.1 hypothetical protein [Yersinia enterocolitica]HEC1648479.1 hypothetical protein [Yersinia enterocolitica]
MKELSVTITRLESHHDGIVVGAKVTFKVYQGGKLLLADTVYGKATTPYSRTYEVDASDEVLLIVEHDRADLPWLNITTSFL